MWQIALIVGSGTGDLESEWTNAFKLCTDWGRDELKRDLYVEFDAICTLSCGGSEMGELDSK